MTPAVSVVLPVYNGMAYLREAVRSVVQQTCRSWELVVVDDGSTDGAAEWVSSVADDRVRVVVEPHTGNLSHVRNVGIASSAGRWVAFLDADDVWLPHKLERQLAFHAANPDVRWSYTGRILIDAGGNRMSERDGTWNAIDGWILPHLLVHRAAIASPTMMIERALLQEIGALDERFYYAGDYELRVRLAVHARCGVVDEPLAMIRQHRASRTTGRPEATLALARVYREFRERAPSPETALLCRQQEAVFRLKASRRYFGRGEWSAGWRTLAGLWRNAPFDRRVYRMAVHGAMQMVRSLRR